MGLHRNELPFFIYRMRELGYPPGWLKEHEREKSGISIVGEEALAEERVEYDVDKFLSIPGFNSPLPSNITDDWKRFGALPMQKMHDLDEMRRCLADGGPREVPDEATTSLSDRLGGGSEVREASEGCAGGVHKKKRKKKRKRAEEADGECWCATRVGVKSKISAESHLKECITRMHYCMHLLFGQKRMNGGHSTGNTVGVFLSGGLISAAVYWKWVEVEK